MKIQATKSNNLIHIENGSITKISSLSERQSTSLLGMKYAYKKLLNRIDREGLFSIGFSDHSADRFGSGFTLKARV